MCPPINIPMYSKRQEVKGEEEHAVESRSDTRLERNIAENANEFYSDIKLYIFSSMMRDGLSSPYEVCDVIPSYFFLYTHCLSFDSIRQPLIKIDFLQSIYICMYISI